MQCIVRIVVPFREEKKIPKTNQRKLNERNTWYFKTIRCECIAKSIEINESDIMECEMQEELGKMCGEKKSKVACGPFNV